MGDKLVQRNAYPMLNWANVDLSEVSGSENTVFTKHWSTWGGICFCRNCKYSVETRNTVALSLSCIIDAMMMIVLFQNNNTFNYIPWMLQINYHSSIILPWQWGQVRGRYCMSRQCALSDASLWLCGPSSFPSFAFVTPVSLAVSTNLDIPNKIINAKQINLDRENDLNGKRMNGGGLEDVGDARQTW